MISCRSHLCHWMSCNRCDWRFQIENKSLLSENSKILFIFEDPRNLSKGLTENNSFQLIQWQIQDFAMGGGATNISALRSNIFPLCGLHIGMTHHCRSTIQAHTNNVAHFLLEKRGPLSSGSSPFN